MLNKCWGQSQLWENPLRDLNAALVLSSNIFMASFNMFSFRSLKNKQRSVCLSEYMLLHIITTQTAETQPTGQKPQTMCFIAGPGALHHWGRADPSQLWSRMGQEMHTMNNKHSIICFPYICVIMCNLPQSSFASKWCIKLKNSSSSSLWKYFKGLAVEALT